MPFRRTIAIFAILIPASCAKDPTPPVPGPPVVGVITVTEQPVTLTTELPGRIAASETSEVRPQVNGLIQARLFREGDLVRAGQALYRIDPTPYQAQVASARAGLSRARASIASSQALARRYGELVKINAIAKQDYDNARTGAGQAQADVAAQEAALRAATIDLARTTVTAPITGRIGRSLATTGALVTVGQPNALATIQRIDPIFVDVTQASADILRLRQQLIAGSLDKAGAAAAEVQLLLEDGSVYPAAGLLNFADVSVDPMTGTQTIRATFPNRLGLLQPGMYARARMAQGTQTRALLVPQRAVSRDEKGRPTVMVVGIGNKADLRILVAPRTIGDNWLVTGGLKPNDRIIVEGGMMLRPGMVVSPRRYDPKAPLPTAGPPGAPSGPQAARK